MCGKERTSIKDVTDESKTSPRVTKTSPSANLIQDFYRGGVVLVTGATGFVGKTLVEKLLRSCPDIAVVYLLMRPKRGQDVVSRHQQLLANSVFDRLRADSECGAHILDKTRPIVGDVAKPGLGLSQDDRRRLIEEVGVVFHSAATVHFDETLQDAVTLNVLGTRSVIKLVRQMPKLKALIYVSTAYSNAEKQVVEERVYPPPADPEAIIRLCPSLDNKVLEGVTESLLKIGHPNTYTFTKALAEWIVQEEAVGLPCAIVRPSIVGAAWREPAPGWVGTATGCTRIMIEIGRGVIRSIFCKQEYIADIIPIDIVVNTLIAASWRTATTSSNAVFVYNCTSGEANPTTWYDFIRSMTRGAIISPIRYVLWHPDARLRTNRMVKMAKRQLQVVEFFTTHEWRFRTNNMKALLQDLSMSGDRDLFDFNLVDMQWDSYIQFYMAGIAKYIHKETAESMEGAWKKVKRLYWANKLLRLLLILIVAKATISFGTYIFQSVVPYELP